MAATATLIYDNDGRLTGSRAVTGRYSRELSLDTANVCKITAQLPDVGD